MPGSRTFLHGVARGDPTTDRVVIWTRVESDRDGVPVEWIVARDRELGQTVVSGEVSAEAEADHTVHVNVAGLHPAQLKASD